MKKRKINPTELTVLDIMRLGVMPKHHQVAAIAAMMVTHIHSAQQPSMAFTKFLSENATDEQLFTDQIAAEAYRQLQLRSKRADLRSISPDSAISGKGVSIDVRINRLCKSIFGNPATWLISGPISPTPTRPHFNWIKRLDDTLVAGVDGFVERGPVSGFVYIIHGRGPVRFFRTNGRVNSMVGLLSYLGLHPRLIANKRIKVDWARRSFIVNDTDILRWTYP